MRWRLQRLWETKPIVLSKRVDETPPNHPETETAIMSDNKHSNALEITKIMGKKRPIVLPKRVDETHPNRPETETAMSDKHSNALKITKIMGKKAHCFAEESG